MCPVEWRVGSGYDLHSVVADRPLILGGIRITNDFGLGGHTDGDVVLHALIDALFGAAGLPDIGEHFPAGDAETKGVASTELLVTAVAEVRSAGWAINNVDLTVVAERPKLSGYKETIRRQVARGLEIAERHVSVKAKTNEGHDAVGQGRAIACHATLTLTRTNPD